MDPPVSEFEKRVSPVVSQISARYARSSVSKPRGCRRRLTRGTYASQELSLRCTVNTGQMNSRVRRRAASRGVVTAVRISSCGGGRSVIYRVGTEQVYGILGSPDTLSLFTRYSRDPYRLYSLEITLLCLCYFQPSRDMSERSYSDTWFRCSNDELGVAIGCGRVAL